MQETGLCHRNPVRCDTFRRLTLKIWPNGGEPAYLVDNRLNAAVRYGALRAP